MHILLTNDDGIYSPSLHALQNELQKLGDVTVVAPAREQSGVSHSITFLSPLVCKQVYDGDRFCGWAVEGSPADCVKLALFELAPQRPDLIVSGMNTGLNAGINVLYSGTVAGAIEGAFFGIDSIAVSLEADEHPPIGKAAGLARQVIEQVLAQKSAEASLYNLNIPLAACEGTPQVKILPMGVERYGEHYLKRKDPKGRTYYWATNEPPPQPGEHATDLTALAEGFVTLTPLQYNMTHPARLQAMTDWRLTLAAETES